MQLRALLDGAYFFPVIYGAFFKKSKGIKSTFDEAPVLVVAPIVITAIGSLLFGLFPDAFIHFFQLAALSAKNILGG